MRVENSDARSDCLSVIRTVETFYEDLSFSTFQYGKQGVRSILNIDTTILESCKSTLESAKVVLELGHIADAFTLLRKLFDDIIVHVYCTIHLKSTSDISLVDKYVEEWVAGKQKLPRSIGTMLKFISRFESLRELQGMINLDDRYTTIRKYCNDNVHSNYFRYLYMNTDCHVETSIANSIFMRFGSFLIDIVVFHFAYLLSIEFPYMSSSDYVDHLEANMPPPKDSQYWVAPYVQAFFDKIIRHRRADVADWIVKKTPMQLR